MAPSLISISQDLDSPGIKVNVAITGDAEQAVHVVFNDQIQNSSDSALYSQTISSAVWNGLTDVDGVRTKEITLPDSAYETLSNGEKISIRVQTGSLVATETNLVYKQAVPFTIVSVTDGVQSAVIKMQLDNTIYEQNGDVNNDGFGITASMPASYNASTVAVSVGSISNSGFATITISDVRPGTYEITVGTYNNYGLKQKSQVVSVSTDPAAATATAFYSFATEDISAGQFDLEFAEKDYSQYSSVNVYAIFKQDDSSVGDEQTVYASPNTDPSGGLDFENNKPTKYVMPSEIFDAIVGYTGSASKKFSIELRLEGVIRLEGETSATTFYGPRTTTRFYKDNQLDAPTVTLDVINWNTGEQKVKADSGDGYGGYVATFDLSGSTTNVTMDASGDAIKSYSYNELLPDANGEYKQLSVTVQRPDINFLDAVNPPMNKSDATEFDITLKAIKRAPAPTVVEFTDITSSHDGSIEFAYVEASANTDLLGRLFLLPLNASTYLVGSELTANIPLATASNEVIDFSAELAPGTKYEMRANTRFNMSSAGFNARYNALNGSSQYLLSTTTSQQGFFTAAPTMTLQVRPTGATNVMGTVRMTCEAKANDINKMMVYVKDVCGQIHANEVIVGDDYIDTCGNRVLNAGGNVTNFNRTVIQDFIFDESIELASPGMFMFGLVDTPDSVDGIEVDEEATAEVIALNTAIIAYNGGVSDYETALDASKNYTEDETWSGHNEIYLGWTASAENLTLRRNDLSNNLIPASEELVESLEADANLKYALLSAAQQTYDSINNSINTWVAAYDAMSAGVDKDEFTHTPQITYSVFTASGEETSDIYATSDVKIPVPSAGYNADYLADRAELKEDLRDAALNDYQVALGLKLAAATANTALDTELATLNGDANTDGSIAEAISAKNTAKASRNASYTALVDAVGDAKEALVGYNSTTHRYGTVTAPLSGSFIRTMNDARTALSSKVQGIEKFVVPALAV